VSWFNSLGSNYRSATVRRVFWPASRQEPERLRAYLGDHYERAAVQLTYKGREAITLGLKQLELPKNSLVAINGFTCYAVYEAITAAGYKPCYLDISKKELNFTAATLGKALKAHPNIKAVMIQNTFGIPADIAAIAKVCQAHNLPLVEDLAHSIGLQYETGQEAGTLGVWAALSFSQDKMIDAVSGGALLAHKPIVQIKKPAAIAKKSRFAARLYPWTTAIIRRTFRLGIGRGLLKFTKSTGLIPRPMNGSAVAVRTVSNWQAREARLAYENLSALIKHRQKIAAIYERLLPAEAKFSTSPQAVYLRYPIMVSEPHRLIKYLKQFNIYLSDIWYDAAIGPKHYTHLTDYDGQCPQADYVASRIINLPTHWQVDEATAKLISGKVLEWLKLNQ
jgi:dTDP-4-amino-4,6-dideoxygalactose transaminase